MVLSEDSELNEKASAVLIKLTLQHEFSQNTIYPDADVRAKAFKTY